MSRNPPNQTTCISTPKPSRSVRLARPDDLPFVVDLQRQWSNNLGFLPRPALAQYIDDAQLLVVVENGQPAGYLNWCCTKDGLVRIPQVAVDPQLLRTSVGTKIVTHLKRAALRGNCSLVRLKSRSDLPANTFWPLLGFRLTATFLNPTTRKLPLYEWTLPLLSSEDLLQAQLTAGRSLRPLLKTRTHPDLRGQLLSHRPDDDDPPA